MYQVLYRKWRPQTFEDVYGQPHVVAALRGEVQTGHLSHAYLFTGSRGTGKTTCAKILAKAVNCLSPKNGDPCNECANCRGIDDGSIMDVVEIDAASNNGVDDVRDLREEVNFAPAVGKYRVYIIDEVHMMSGSAFNALLKTLEEPPAYVIFILATTEVHKLPATVLSRCQRFDFLRIPPADIAARLQQVAEGEGFTLDPAAANLLARLADGALRDALSLLDQCLSRSQNVTIEVVADACGLAGREYLYELSAAVREKNSAGALALVDKLYRSSHDMMRLCEEWLSFYRELMICKSVSAPAELIVATDAEIERLKAEAAQYELPAVLQAMDTLHAAIGRMNSGMSRRMEMELAVLRLSNPRLDTSPESLLRRMQELENQLRRLAADGLVPAASSAAPPDVPHPAESLPTPTPAQPAQPATQTPDRTQKAVQTVEQPFENWADVLEALRQSSAPLYGVLSDSSAVIKGEVVGISTGNELFRTLVAQDNNKRLLADAIASVTGKRYRVAMRLIPKAEAAQAPTDPLAEFLRRGEQLGAEIDRT